MHIDMSIATRIWISHHNLICRVLMLVSIQNAMSRNKISSHNESQVIQLRRPHSVYPLYLTPIRITVLLRASWSGHISRTLAPKNSKSIKKPAMLVCFFLKVWLTRFHLPRICPSKIKTCSHILVIIHAQKRDPRQINQQLV